MNEPRNDDVVWISPYVTVLMRRLQLESARYGSLDELLADRRPARLPRPDEDVE